MTMRPMRGGSLLRRLGRWGMSDYGWTWGDLAGELIGRRVALARPWGTLDDDGRPSVQAIKDALLFLIGGQRKQHFIRDGRTRLVVGARCLGFGRVVTTRFPDTLWNGASVRQLLDGVLQGQVERLARSLPQHQHRRKGYLGARTGCFRTSQ